MHVRCPILKLYHDDVGHYSRKTTVTSLSDRFWWPYMYKEVCEYVKTCEDCQRMSFISKYSSRLKVPWTRLFSTLSIEFAGPFPTTTRGMSFLLVCVEYLTGWPLAYPNTSAVASEVIAFIKQHTIFSFGRPRLITSDNSPCFTASSLEKFPSKCGIN